MTLAVVVLINMGYNLFLDDIREPVVVSKYMFPIELREMYKSEGWYIARNYTEFVEFITHHGLPTKISFDHDLADEHYISDNVTEYKEKTGYDCAKWLVDYCLTNKLSLPDYYCHSMNPVGVENILSILNRYKNENII